MLKNKEIEKKLDDLKKYRVVCKCGHTMYPVTHSMSCTWCGRVNLTEAEQEKIDKDEFKNNLLAMLKKQKGE